jgi:hypothetical protein
LKFVELISSDARVAGNPMFHANVAVATQCLLADAGIPALKSAILDANLEAFHVSIG